MIRGSYKEHYFKPRGVNLSDLEQVDLTFDEIEALKYVDFEGMKMDEAAKKMRISKPTFCRMANMARKKVADALINGKAINLQNYNLTNITMPNRDGTGPEGKGPQTGHGLGRCRGNSANDNEAPRRGFGRGFGRGAGRGRR